MVREHRSAAERDRHGRRLDEVVVADDQIVAVAARDRVVADLQVVDVERDLGRGVVVMHRDGRELVEQVVLVGHEHASDRQEPLGLGVECVDELVDLVGETDVRADVGRQHLQVVACDHVVACAAVDRVDADLVRRIDDDVGEPGGPVGCRHDRVDRVDERPEPPCPREQRRRHLERGRDGLRLREVDDLREQGQVVARDQVVAGTAVDRVVPRHLAEVVRDVGHEARQRREARPRSGRGTSSRRAGRPRRR